jgi:glycosyltransferase involved in cell wall biosynthesis
VVPWGIVVVLLENPDGAACDRLRATAEFSGSRIVAVGYDCIPVVSADLLPDADVERFVRYLGVVKHLSAVAAISESAAREFRGFVRALSAQGLGGPEVVVCSLPTHSPGRFVAISDILESTNVLIVGSIEPGKNQANVALAAEIAWRQGRKFDLTFVSGSTWNLEAMQIIDRLRRVGRPITVAEKVSEAELEKFYSGARFSVFVSLHEGFGLPVVESFSHGIPAITSCFGPMADVGLSNGAVLVDPSDVTDLSRAMMLLLDDDDELLRLRAQIDQREQRERRTWDEYAEDLWRLLVASAQGTP